MVNLEPRHRRGIKQLPNILSISRIVLSFLLLFFLKNLLLFILSYLLIGITDVLDGFIARKYKLESDLGAKLDSTADLVFYTILTIYFVTEHQELLLRFLLLIFIIIAIRSANIFIGIRKYRKLIMIHTVANKISGVLIYLLPIILIYGLHRFIPGILILVSLSSLEESIILLTSSKYAIDVNKKSIFIN